MHWWLFVLLMAPLAAQAREVESGLAAVRQRLQSQPVMQRKLSGVQHRAALVSATLAETAASLEGIAGPGAGRQLEYLRERLLTASRSIEGDFASIEAKLAGLGLPEKLDAWREFVQHYRTRMAEVDTELASLAAAAGGLSREELRTRLASLKAEFGGGAGGGGGILESVRGAAQIVPGGSLSVAEAAPRPADDAPTPADLAETKIVRFTRQIRDMATALGGKPTALYNWVATHTEYVAYPGQMQDSQAVMQSGRGNDFDQATLLIALLRASRIPARYVCVDALMPRADIREWMGVKDESLILGLLSRGLDFSLFPSLEPARAVATRVWVEAYLETASGKFWVVMDPARKRRSFQPGIVLALPPYDRMAYLKAFKPVLPGEAYLDALRAEFQKKYLGRGFNEVPYTGTLLTPPPASTEPPYTVMKLQFRSSEVPQALRHRVNLSLTEYGRQTRYLSVDLSLPEVSLQSLSLTYRPATAADRQVVEAFGGLENAPAAVVNLVPEFRMAGPVIASGTTPIATGAAMDLTVTHLPGGQGSTQYVSRNLHSAGETAAVVLGANQICEELLTSRISSFLDRLPLAPAAEATRRLLDLAALRYLHRLGVETQRLSDFLQVRFIQSAGVENAITFASLEPQNLFDRPFVVTPGRLRIHANPRHSPFVDLNRLDQSDPVLKVAWQLHNDAASVLEHEIWEELVMVPSVSTIKVLQTAIRDGVPIYIVNRNNAATELLKIESTAANKRTMQERINAGATLTVPQRPVTIGSWKGQGWIEEYDDGWSYAYIIEANLPQGGLAPGGDTGATPPQPRPPTSEPGPIGSPAPTGGTSCSDPVNVSNGNVFEQAVDYLLARPSPGILFQRTYNSLALADGPLGPGWRHSYQMSLKVAGATTTLLDESGGVLNFRLVNGAYISPPGYNLTLKSDAQGFLVRRKDGVQLRFDLRGVFQSITDRNQNVLQLAYEGDRLRRITDRTGRSVTLSYDGKGRLSTLEDFTSRRISYEYDAVGHLAAVTDLAGNRTVYAYYTDGIFNHLLKSITTPQERVTRFEYYGNGKAARVTDPGGRSVQFLYLPLRNETHVLDEQALLWSYQYNALGNVVRVIQPDGSFLGSVYNADAKLEAATDAAGYITRFTYDAAGNVTSVTDPLGRTVKFTYEPEFNQVSAILDARGNLTRFERDARANLTRVVQPLGAETQLAWDGAGNLTSVTDAEGNAVKLGYDELGNPTEARDALGNVAKFEYNRLGRLTRSVDAMGGETRREYDVLDRLVKLIDALGRTASAAYDRDGRLGQVIDTGGRTTKFFYDPMNHPIQVADPLGQLTRYAYATAECACSVTANLSWFQDAAGHGQTQTYDSHDRLVSTTDALGNKTQYSYDARGSLVRKVDANGSATTFEYDAAGQLVRKAFSDGAEVRFSYDAAGNLVSAGNTHVWVTFTYNERNQVTSAKDSRFDKTIYYSYNRLGQRTALTDSEGGTTSYAYDANGRLISLTAPSGASAAFSYDAADRLTQLKYSNSTTAAWKYDAAGRVAELTHGKFAIAYRYDASGNRTAVTDGSGSHAYQYDALNRLTGAQHEALPAEVYSYDAAGNRTGSATDPAYQYDSAGRLTAAEGSTFTYDKNGSLTSKTTMKGKTAYTWDMENRLVRVELPDGGTVSYKYDPFGRRIEKSVNGVVTAYVYDGNAILLELDASGQMIARYMSGPGIDWPLMVEREGQTWFYHDDALGSIAGLTDAAGGVVRSYAYDTWGQPAERTASSTADPPAGLAPAGPGSRPGARLRAGGLAPHAEATGPANPFLFAGREFDAETGLYYLRARYYDPAVGRFISSDPLDLPGLVITGQSPSHEEALLPPAAAAAFRGGDPDLMPTLRAAAQYTPQRLNPYAYALNNPIRLRDPSGLQTCRIDPGGKSPFGGVFASGDLHVELDPGKLKLTFENGAALGVVDQAKLKAHVDVGAALGIGAQGKVEVDVNVSTAQPATGSAAAAAASTTGPNTTPAQDQGSTNAARVEKIIKSLW